MRFEPLTTFNNYNATVINYAYFILHIHACVHALYSRLEEHTVKLYSFEIYSVGLLNRHLQLAQLKLDIIW